MNLQLTPVVPLVLRRGRQTGRDGRMACRGRRKVFGEGREVPGRRRRVGRG